MQTILAAPTPQTQAQKPPAQLELWTPRELEQTLDAEAYHTRRQGFFSLLVAGSDCTGRLPQKHQRSYRLTELATVIPLLNPKRDSWISQAEFSQPNRRVVNIARVGLLFVDFDTYKTEWGKGKTPAALAEAILYGCADEGIPPPSIIIFSGQGLQAKWLLDSALPRDALPRWNACQRFLIDRLSYWGADPAARDASRVLRLVNTTNSKTGRRVHVEHVTEGEDGQPVRYSFDQLAEYLLPMTRQEIAESREATQRKKAERLEKWKIIEGERKPGLRPLSGRQLAWDRLNDLRRLATLRGGVAEGQRMVHLFWQLNFLLLSGATTSGLMWHEAAALASQIDRSWGYGTGELSTLYGKARQYEAGEQVEFNGKKYPALYTPRNDTLISLFQITDDEQREMKTIITPDLARERHADREAARRRAAGAIPREQYEQAIAQSVEQRRAQARLLRAQGRSYREIAAEMGASRRAVIDWCK